MNKSKTERIILPIVGILIVLGIWHLAALRLGPFVLPTPISIAETFFTLIYSSKKILIQGGGKYGIGPHLLYTATMTLLGALIGTVLGVTIGIVLGWIKKLRRLTEPLIEAIRTIPPLAIIPFFILWFGPSRIAQLGIIVFYCTVMLLFNTLSAINNINPVYSQFAYTLGASRGYVYRTVVLPGIMPEIIGGVRVVIGVSWGIQIVAELMGSQQGLGQIFSMMTSLQALEIILSSILWIALLAYLVDLIFIKISNYVIRWSPSITK